MRTIATLIALTASSALAQDIYVDSGQVVGAEDFNGLALGLGDIDGDGDLDAVTASYVQPSVAYLNDGTGVFTSTGQELPTSLAARVILRDFDADGDLDVFILSHSFGSHILFNDGAGAFTPGEQNLGSFQAHGADAGDLDGDGDIDLFVTNVNGHVNTALFNDGTGMFVYSEANNHPAARGATLGDLDGDGDLDVFLAHGNGPQAPLGNRVMLNDGTGHFTDTGQLLGSTYSIDAKLADFDADGDLDAFVANASLFDNAPGNAVYLNDGTGFFTHTGQDLGNGDTGGADVADVDRDGDLDIFTSNGIDQPVIWINDGLAGFAIGQTLDDPPTVMGEAALGDFDGDGDADAFVLGGKPGGETVFLNIICEADVNADGELNLLDFVAFQNAWTAQEPSADCDGDGAFTIIDFVCFQNLFASGC